MTKNTNDPFAEKAEGLINAIKALVDSKVEDTSCYRMLIDNFCAYQMGARNGKDKLGRWDTNKIRNHCLRSVEAHKAIIKNEKGIHRDHVIPMKFIVEKLLALPTPSTTAIMDTLETHAVFAAITEEEHNMLNIKHRSRMPDGYSIEGDDLCDQPYARYIKVFPDKFKDGFEGNSFFEPTPDKGW
ncbi:hypothetical protein ACMXYR_05495 [Neptuniibacter sp. QD29_5]|uniref:hypothetical protein n=1 Tax=Neptuniibacter sp. QD29_5 TaxID=3398207 RepID=UPI0039F5DF8F